jgi:pimeloyl-ACP methyl ester carboxylesterase
VKELGKDFDVYAFAYAQTAPVDAVALSNGLRARLAALKRAGYREIVLVGHSAGGVLARLAVEHDPAAGVTKIIQVACPNEGAQLADLGIGLPRTQVGFIHSLSPERRKAACKVCTTPVPKDVDFAVVVCKYGRLQGDTLVDLSSQWPADLQKQGVPIVLAPVSHSNAVKDPATVKEIAALAREKLARWDETEVAQARKVLFDSASKAGLLPRVIGVVRDRIGLDKK